MEGLLLSVTAAQGGWQDSRWLRTRFDRRLDAESSPKIYRWPISALGLLLAYGPHTLLVFVHVESIGHAMQRHVYICGKTLVACVPLKHSGSSLDAAVRVVYHVRIHSFSG